MVQTASIVGKVEYRIGDGPAVEIPEGPVEVSITETDATLSWVSGDSHGSAALPVDDFRRYVEEGEVKLDGPEQVEV
ncbi:hypothetical protein [Hydrogenophaga sp. PAMC20947]|uniref:hypothetical protein n=1 Tax=Hydrogenophaga sp. PAMC20947 TaxID=2565558 RepID=UPI00109E06BA|nr:hypothetical protein [Hydrogenophaga sp. PAMC20947]QCB46294.1 hypothetical protein E5678_09830 [Hydrogenophaga sp. PAMC20947]